MSGQVGRVHYLDALRGVCAVGVMLFHYTRWENVASDGFTFALLQKAGIYCVEIFFVISGFSLMLAYAGKPAWRGMGLARFAVRRFFRIVPLLYLVFIATVALRILKAALGHPSSEEFGFEAWRSFALLPIIVWPADALSVGSWSLGVEMGLYILFPILLFATNWPRAFTIGGLAAFAILTLCSAFVFLSGTSSFEEAWPVYATVINHLNFFIAGILLALAHRNGLLPGRPLLLGILAASLAVFLLVSPAVADRFAIVTGLPDVLFTLASIGIVVGFGAFAARSGQARFLVWLGNISYSVYLVHPIVHGAVPGHTRMGPVISVAVCVAITLLVATFVHRYLEKPFQDLGRTLLQPRAKMAAAD